MIAITKNQMEDIWNNKPVGYLRTFKKNQKGVKAFQVTIQGYERKLHPEETFTILSKRMDDAKWEAQNLLRNKYPELKFEGYFYTVK